VSGLLPRFIIVDNSDKERPEMQKIDTSISVPNEILDWVKAAYQMGSQEGDLSNYNGASPVVVPRSEEAKELFDKFLIVINDHINNKKEVDVAELWGRAWELADKVATIGACAESIENLIVSEPVARWAIQYVSYHIEHVAIQVTERVAGSNYERFSKEFLSAIKKAGARGLTKYELSRIQPFSLHKPRDRKEILDDLVEARKIAFVQIPGPGRKRYAYVAIKIED